MIVEFSIIIVYMQQQEMKRKRKKVLWIDADPVYIEHQKRELSNKELDCHLFSFCKMRDAFNFIEKQILEKNRKLHYIILDEKSIGKTFLPGSLEKFQGLNSFLKKPEIIVLTGENNNQLRNSLMQYPSVSALLMKPVPPGYIEFLITGQVT
jgi:response regulator RpfG family c-di-GMP phosphodiesterase